MSKLIQYFFLILIPFYPIWAWLVFSITKRNIDIFTFLLFVPLVVFYLFTQKVRIPKYLIFLILFTIYHLCSVFINHLIPPQDSLLFYILSDENLLACLVLFTVENTRFEGKFIKGLNISILLIVIIALVVSLMQIKFNTFFISSEIIKNPQSAFYFSQHRNFSIFSWTNINSVGITFPILISILLSSPGMTRNTFPLVLLSGIIVSFLTKARYIMLSIIIVISQLFFVNKINITKKIYIIVLIFTLLAVLIFLGNAYDLNLQRIIDERILEKGTGMSSARARLTSLQVFLQVFPENPWLGVGPQTGFNVIQLLRGVTTSIHVGYLSYLYFYGIFGALLVFTSIFYLLKDAWIIGKKLMFWGSFYGLLAFCFANLTFVYFNFSEIGIILAVIFMKYYKDKISDNSSDDLVYKKPSSEPPL